MPLYNALCTPAVTVNEFPYTVVRRDYDWLGKDPVETIHFKVLDTQLGFETLIGVPWQQVFEFVMKCPGQARRPSFALTKGGRVLYTRRNAVLFDSEAEQDTAPKVMRGTFSVNLQDTGEPLVEVLGGDLWAHNRDTEMLKKRAYMSPPVVTLDFNQAII